MLNFEFQYHKHVTCVQKHVFCSFLPRSNVCHSNYVSKNMFFLSQQPKHFVPSIGSLGFHHSTTPLLCKGNFVVHSVVFGLPQQKYDNEFDDDVVDEFDNNVVDKFDDDVVDEFDDDVVDEFDDDVVVEDDEWIEEFDSSFVSNKKLCHLGEVEEDSGLRREDVDVSFVLNKKSCPLGEVEEDGGLRREDVGVSFVTEKELRHDGLKEVGLLNEDGVPQEKYDNDDEFDDVVVVDDGWIEEFDLSFVSNNKKLCNLGEVEEDGGLRRKYVVDVSFVAEKELRHDDLKEVGLLNEGGVIFLEEMDENVLSNRILELSKTNKTRSAMEYFRSMEMFGLCPNIRACNSLLSGLLRNGSFDDCFKVFDFMKAKRITTGHSFSLILMACAKAQGCDSALKLYRKLERECDVEKDFDDVVYNTMISICKEVYNWSEIERLWRSMKESGCARTLVTYRLLISSFVRCNQSELALYAYHEMVQNGFEPNNNILNSIICVCAKEGKWDDALTVFQKMLTGDFKPNLVACNVLINSLGRAGELKLAFQVYNSMKSLDQKPDAYTYNALMSSLDKANKHAEALQLYDWIERSQMCEFNKHLYNTALMSCSNLRLWDKAVEILWQMEASGLSDLTVSYNLVIKTCELARKPTIALQVYEHMVHQKCTPNIFTYLSIIRCCTSGDLYEELEEILTKTVPNAALYDAAVQGMCLRGKVNLANKVYTKMLEHGLEPDVKTRVLMHRKIRK